jgi:hypothetical protein
MREALRWARMSLDPEAEVMTSSSPMIAAAPSIETKRRVRALTDDEPTVMRKAVSDDDVFTSAPPITTRSTTPRTTIPDDGPFASSETGESLTFSLRNDPVFSLRRPTDKHDVSELSPSTERLPGQEGQKAPENDLGLPEIGVQGPPSEDIPMEYTRPIVVPAGIGALRGTLPMPHGPTGSGIVPVPTPAAGVPAPPPSNPQVQQVPAAPISSRRPIASQRAAGAAPPSSAGTKVFLTLALLAMLGGTVIVLSMRKQPHVEPDPVATSTSAATPSAAPSDTPSAEPVASASADPAPTTSSSPSASASADPSATASAEASVTVAAAPKPKPRPKPSATASTAQAPADGTSSAAPSASLSPVPLPLPLPVPTPTPTPTPDESGL